MTDLVKMGIVAAVMGVLLLVGLAANYTTPEQETTEVQEATQEVTEVNVLPPKSLEMLDPVYSEKAVFDDGTIRVSFDAAYTSEGVESGLPFWLHNASDDVIVILWDRCSMQLPSANTVNVLNEEQVEGSSFESPEHISIAPGGDLFEAVFPVSEVQLEDGSFSPSCNVLDQGPFVFVLALEVVDPCCPGPIVKYYPFRFVIR